VLVVRGHEHDGRQVGITRGQLQAIELRHVDIEQQELRGLAPNGGQGFDPVGCLGHDADAAELPEQADQQPSRWLFVVSDHDLHAASLSIGNRSSTLNPPRSLLRVFNVAASP
jgi:hypothetical protein